MDLVEINMVGLESPQRVFAGFDDMQTGVSAIIRSGAYRRMNFGRHNNVITTAGRR